MIKIKTLINKKLAQNKYENSKAKPKINRRSNDRPLYAFEDTGKCIFNTNKILDKCL